MSRPVLAVHLGAGEWNIDEEMKVKIKQLITQSLEEGYKAGLTGSGVDMVVKAIEILEDSGLVNAGVGSIVDLSGAISMDAGIMYSRYAKAGAVAYVKYPKNPILLARYVMELTDHVILAGEAADKLAEKIGLEKHPGPLDRVMRRYRETMAKIRLGHVDGLRYINSVNLWIKLGFLDTVGAVARDSSGEFAAGVSTGGVFLKMPGRVGDSAIPGAGFYANSCGAAAATGIGEYILLSLLTYNVVQDICRGSDVVRAVGKSLKVMTERYGPGTAGLIAVDVSGKVYGACNTKAMPWGYIDEDGKIRIFV
uniref:Plant-type L-asparaginase n=1 Tax=Ignisphaera aggregans TaxID=334771 RepID=A0A7C2ZLV3_9CREN